MTRGTILLVEDEAKLRTLLADALRDEGHEVVDTGSPRDAQRLLDERPFDVLVVDNLMPELTGLELIRSLVSSAPAGERPQIYRSADRPFTLRFRVLDEPFTVRLDAWLPFDTFLRAGFGHVVRGRDHILIVERGVSLVWLGPNGRPSPPFYAASDFAQQPRYRVPAATLQLANLGGTAHRERRF